ncbi:hypothetical protein HYH02_015044 [Chlamydomonas schloesseri]|uniref:Methyltransferase FkbM domain-containing protein n=1 Tax=Chlamydomonas schloesseri TaxID=2026947 RepID=A0A835VQ90_9CHLO|nr:hypothetical protein HYH02_015044 [Chlamydomonas schloesseri]|eukprot:KAG2425217.1 hypothetical protein HYH02_015044 [Chlamydomonas schloesseri]
MPLSSIVQEDVLLLKVDTEGYEINVFAGAMELLTKYKVHNVVVEVKRFNDPDKRELLRSLASSGLKYIYNYMEDYGAEVPADQVYNIKPRITDVTDIVMNRRDSEHVCCEDFWLRREPLDL